MAPRRNASGVGSPATGTTTAAAAPPSASTPSKLTSSAASSQAGTTSSLKGTPAKSAGAKKGPQDTKEILLDFLDRYVSETPQRVKIIDVFMAFLVALGLPFNAFLSGFSATVGQFVLSASLRIQTNPANKKGNFETLSDERAFADFVLGSLILHLFCINFIN